MLSIRLVAIMALAVAALSCLLVWGAGGRSDREGSVGRSALPLSRRRPTIRVRRRARVVERSKLESTNADRALLEAMDRVVAIVTRTAELVPDHVDGVAVDTSFVADVWQRVIRDWPRQGGAPPLRAARPWLA